MRRLLPACASVGGSNRPVLAIAYCMTGLLAFAGQDVVMKVLSDRYAVLELAFVRSLVVIAVIGAAVSMTAGPHALRTGRPGLHALRGALALCSYTLYYLAIAAMPLVEAATVYAIAPVLVTAISVPLLGERVGVRRWCAIAIALAGVLIMLQPGTEVFQFAALFSIAAAVIYAFGVVITRQLGKTDSASTMAFYSGLVYLAGSLVIGLGISSLQLDPSADPSRAFLLRAWQWPEPRDLALMGAGGLCATIGFIGLLGAYRLAPVSIVSPFEYSQLLWALVLGYVVWGYLPGPTTVAGAAVVVGCGIYIFRRELALSSKGEGGELPRATAPVAVAGSLPPRQVYSYGSLLRITSDTVFKPEHLIAVGLVLLGAALILQVSA